MADITVYTTPTCGYCHAVKGYLKSKNLDYSTKDITTDSDAYQEILDKSGQLGVPVLDIAGKIVVGFNRPVIDILLREAKLV